MDVSIDQCPCGKPLVHTEDPEDACLVPLARLQESNPSRWDGPACIACIVCGRELGCRRRLEGVRSLHSETESGMCATCCDAYGDPVEWPCATIVVLDGPAT